MNGTISIELLLDPVAEARVRTEWELLDRHKLSSMAAHRGASNRPHITVFAAPASDLLRADSERLGAEALTVPMAITLSAPLLFGSGERLVLARSIVPTTALLHVHAAVHGQLSAHDPDPRLIPGRWMPHVTLARRLQRASLPEAIGVLEERLGADIHAEVVGVRRWDSAHRIVTTLAGHPATPSG